MTNAYPDLVAAGRSLCDTQLLSREEGASDGEIAAFLSANRAHLERARRAAESPCRVPLEYTQGFYTRHMNDITALRDLARAFALEAAAAERQQATSAVIEIGLGLLNVANASRCGGIITDMLVSIAIAGVGIDPLRKIRTMLGVDSARSLAEALTTIHARREPFEAIVVRDADWEAKTRDPNEPGSAAELDLPDDDNENEEVRAFRAALRAFSRLPPSEINKLHRQIDDRELTMIRLLMIEAALHAHRLLHGEFPADLTALTPAILPALPCDPFSDQPFRYRRLNGRFDLHSVGPNGGNTEGRVSSWLEVQYGDANLCLDVADYQPACAIARPRPGLVQRAMGTLKSIVTFARRRAGA